MDYTGIREVQLLDEDIARFYQGELDFNLRENQYLMLRDMSGKVVDKKFFHDGKLEDVRFPILKSEYCGELKPRNDYQCLAFHMLKDRRIPLKLFHSVYGGGKDIAMATEAMSLIEKGTFKKIIYIRPNVTVKDVPEIGYLKGSEKEKLGWTLAPLWDKLGGREAVEQLCEDDKIELVGLPFIRGRSFDDCICYVTEAQNITKEVAALMISRMGENSEIWFNGDCHSQTDKRLYDENNGLRAMIEKLSGNPLFECVYSPITERSALARLAATIMDDKN